MPRDTVANALEKASVSELEPSDGVTGEFGEMLVMDVRNEDDSSVSQSSDSTPGTVLMLFHLVRYAILQQIYQDFLGIDCL